MATEIILILSSIVGALVLAVKFPEFTSRWFARIAKARMAVFAVALFFIGLFLVSSGMFGLMLLGMGTLALLTLGLGAELGLFGW